MEWNGSTHRSKRIQYVGTKHPVDAAAMAAPLTRCAAEMQGTPCWALWELQLQPMHPDKPQARLGADLGSSPGSPFILESHVTT